MPNSPFSPTPIPDRADLLAHIRTELRTTQAFAFDALRAHHDPEALHAWDALTLIHDSAQGLLAVIDASKDET